jgi:hypothetical protein
MGKDKRVGLEQSEWSFNEYTDAFEEFFLDNVTSGEFDDWLRLSTREKFEVIAVGRADRAPEGRYELVRRDMPERALMRVLTMPAGQRLIVYARGPEQTFSDKGHQVQIRYYGLFKDFCLQMARHWSKPISNEFRQERDHYPDNHAIWKQFIQVQSLPYLERPPVKSPVAKADSIEVKDKMGGPTNIKEKQKPGPKPFKRTVHLERVERFKKLQVDFPQLGKEQISNKMIDEKNTTGLTWKAVKESFKKTNQEWD